MPARVPTPVDPGARAVIEPVVQPLYHAMTMTAAAPVNLRYFQNTGGLNELLAFPGLLSGGQLPNPKIFVVYGIRLVYSEFVQNDALINDIKIIGYSSTFELFVGVKQYVMVPAFYISSGLGVSGSGVDIVGGVSNLTATMGFPSFFNRFSIEKRKITLPPQQGFYCDLNPRAVTATMMRANRLIWCMLDGEFGREVM